MVSVEDAREAQERMMETVRGNPVPFALLGVGLGMLLVAGLRMRSGPEEGFSRQEPARFTGPSGRYGGYGATSEYATAESAYVPPSYREARAGNGEARTRAARERLQQMQERAGSMTREIRERANRLTGSARDYAGAAQHRISGMRYQMGDYAERSARTFEDHPLLTGAAAFAIGAVVGLLVPRSRREDEMFGETRERFVERASGVGREAYERAKEVASETARTVREEGAEAAERVEREIREQTEETSRVQH